MFEATRLPVTTGPTQQVLIVERNPLAAGRIERCLRASALGLATVTMATALEDIPSAVQRGDTDAVLVGDGFHPEAVLAWLRAHARLLRVPVILLGEGDSALGEAALEAGAADALRLPVSEPHLLERAIRRARARLLAQAPTPAHDAELRQSLRLEAIGRLTGGVAHDFSNLLTIMMGASERMREGVPAGTRVHTEANLILGCCERGAALTRQLLAFSRRQPADPRPVDLRALIASSSRLLSPLVGEHIFLVVEADADVWQVIADAAQFDQIVINLVLNARDAMPGGGPLILRLRNAWVDEAGGAASARTPGEYVLFEVVDCGIGMSGETMARAFEPFFTTKEEHHGTGLGLATVQEIVGELGGHVRIDSAAGRGTTVGVYLPRSTGDAAAQAPPGKAALPARGTETVLLTEDEAAIRDLVQTILERHGYTVIVAAGAPDAAALAESWSGPIDLLVSDIVMPGGAGPELAERLRQLRPDMRVLYISGYPGPDGADTAQAGGAFLQKPFTRQLLLQALRDVLDGPAQAAQ